MSTVTNNMREVIVSLCACCVMMGVSSAQDDAAGEPLFLTPLLEQNNVAEAQRLSRVSPEIGNMTSYSGYFTINKTCGSHLFFWFFPAQRNWKEAPVMLWLQGGPGFSFVWGLFCEIGPLTYDGKLGTREYSWNVDNNLLFIEQPIGTGYSFTENGCYAKNEEDVGRHLYSGVVQFFQLFPELRSNKFYISGESYAGHFIPALGYTIHKNNPTANVEINLTGMMIGNGWMDAEYQIDMANFLYQHGLIDDEGRDIYTKTQQEVVKLIQNKEYQKAYNSFTIDGELYFKYVGNVDIYNYMENSKTIESKPYETFIEKLETRRALHVGSANYSFSSIEAINNLEGSNDIIISVKPWVEELLEHYPIVFYTGQLDVICAYPTVVNFQNALNWSGKSDFQKSPRQKWCVGDLQVGHFKGAHNLYDVMVRKAGHSVPFYQPYWSYILANSVTSGTPTNPLHGLTPC